MSFITSLFSKPKKPKPIIPPKVTDPEVQNRAADQMRRASLARGRSSTVLADGKGLGFVG